MVPILELLASETFTRTWKIDGMISVRGPLRFGAPETSENTSLLKVIPGFQPSWCAGPTGSTRSGDLQTDAESV
jgi:hypothetical protein